MPYQDVTLRHEADVALAAYADELAAEIAKTAATYDQLGQFPHEHFALLEQRGALRLTVPLAYGGRGLSLYSLLIFQERLARGNGSTALSLGWHLMALAYLSYGRTWPEEALRQLSRDVVEKGHLINILITDREAGNLLRGATASTVARKTNGGYLIRGHKAFCSSAPALQQMVVYALVEDEGRMAEFLVPKTERIQIIENWNSLGMRSTGSHDMVFDDVFVPSHALQGYIDKGQPSSFTVGSKAFGLQISAVYLGIATAARNCAIKFSDQYISASLNTSIFDAPVVQQKIGEMEALIGSAKIILYGLAERWERYEHLRHRLEKEVAIAKHTVTNQAIRAVELAMSIVGGHALNKHMPLERYFRDVQCGLYNPPQDDMVLALLAKEATASYRNHPTSASSLVGFYAGDAIKNNHPQKKTEAFTV